MTLSPNNPFNTPFWGPQILWGSDGDDVLSFAGNPWGEDTYVYANGGNDTVVNNGWARSIVFAGWGDDVVSGGSSADIIFGDAGDDLLFGNAGDDSIIGGTGNDILVGGSGRDYLNGGQGSDVIIAGVGDQVDNGSFPNWWGQLFNDQDTIVIDPRSGTQGVVQVSGFDYNDTLDLSHLPGVGLDDVFRVGNTVIINDEATNTAIGITGIGWGLGNPTVATWTGHLILSEDIFFGKG